MRRIMTVFTVILCNTLLLVACSKSLEKMSATELLDLGEKYLLEMNYEKALVYFNKLIEVEPRNPRSYTGASEAYIGLSDAPPAVNVLKIGLESFPDDIELQTDFLTRLIAIDKINPDWYLRLAHIYIDRSDIDSASVLLDQGLGVVDMPVDGKAKLQELLDDLIYQEEREKATTLAVPFLEEIAALCATESYDAVFEKMQSEEFGKVTALVDFLREPFISKTPSGKIGVYGVDSTTYGNYMLYYGDYLDNVRNGNGQWFSYYEGQNYFAKGFWQDDKPNGEMTIKEWNSGLAENVTYRIINGNVVNGLWNGDIIWSFERDSELTHIFPVQFEMGHWIILEADNDDGKTRYVVSKSGNTGDNNTGVMSTKTPNEREGVIGFIHE